MGRRRTIIVEDSGTVTEYVKGGKGGGDSVVCPTCRSLGPAGEKPEKCGTCGTWLDYEVEAGAGE